MFHWLRTLFRSPPDPVADFTARRGELLHQWFGAAGVSGRPKWLNWVEYEASGEPLFVRKFAFAPVVVRFEPLPDGPLDDVPQAREPRAVVAVFRWQRGRWTTDGRAVFNLTPQQVAEQLK
ncbi:MAG: hypothetical protein ABGY75_01430 [Gemmataceae bacterium]